jgi:hypothetical protein
LGNGEKRQFSAVKSKERVKGVEPSTSSLGSGSPKLELLASQEVTSTQKSAVGEAVGGNVFNRSGNDSKLDREPVFTDQIKDCLLSLITENWDILLERTRMALVNVVRNIIEIH